MPETTTPYKPFLSPQKNRQRSSAQIVGTIEKGLQSAHQATVYHNFLFVHRHLISSFAPLFIAQIINLHPISALLTLGISVTALIFLVKRFMADRLPSYEEYFQKFYWLYYFQNKQVQLSQAAQKQFQQCLEQNENPIETYQHTLVIHFINFTLSYLVLSQIAHFICTFFPNPVLTSTTLTTEILCSLGALLIERKKQLSQARNHRHKTKLLNLVLYMQAPYQPSSPSSPVKPQPNSTPPVSAKMSWLYCLIALTLIGINLSHVSTLMLSHYISILALTATLTITGLLLKNLLKKESVRTEIQTSLTTYSAAHALMHLGKSKVLQFFPSLVEKAIPTVMARFLLSIISMYTFLLYLYHLVVKKEQQDTLMIHKTLSQQLTPLDRLHLVNTEQFFATTDISNDDQPLQKGKNHDRHTSP